LLHFQTFFEVYHNPLFGSSANEGKTGLTLTVFVDEIKSPRVKGCDFYDYVWFLSQSIPVSITHLSQRMKQTGHLADDAILTAEDLKSRLCKRFAAVDFVRPKKTCCHS